MEIIGLILIIAAYEALKEGAKHAGTKAKSAAKTKWNDRPKASKASGKAGKSRPASSGRVGRSVGRALGAGVAGAAAGGRGFLSGAREGWPQGKQRAYDWHERRTAKPVKVESASPNADASRAKLLKLRDSGYEGPIDEHGVAVSDDRMRPAATPIVVPARRPAVVGTSALAEAPADEFSPQSLHDSHIVVDEDGDGAFRVHPKGDQGAGFPFVAKSVGEAKEKARGILADKGVSEGWLEAKGTEYDEQFVDELKVDQPQGLASVTPITGGKEDMSAVIETVTGGETYNLESLIAELQSIATEAKAELEDAGADEERSQQDATRIETMLSTLGALDLDPDTLKEISALGEDSSARLAAAQNRKAAAEARFAHAEAAAKGVDARHRLMQQAHDETPHAADKRFYER